MEIAPEIDQGVYWFAYKEYACEEGRIVAWATGKEEALVKTEAGPTGRGKQC
jgi:hypothetical protein